MLRSVRMITILRPLVLISQLRGHTDAVLALSFSPDGRYLLTASHDGTARIYPVHFEDVLTLARAALSSRELTCVERVKYLHEGACPTPTLGVTSTP
jgi:WD40 repeat protein